MTQLAELGIKIEAGDIKAAVAELRKLEGQSGKTEKATVSLTTKATILAGAAAATAGAYKMLRAAIDVTAEFQMLNASLETVTGSAENATAAMDMIRAMAVQTPFSVQQLTEAFIKLKALGLEPSEAAIKSYGNTASAMGKGLNQMIEAVADAATGEFERLKEFGIKSKSEGDNVSFTFQGVTTTVKKEAGAIAGYLRGIGDVKFAGAMEKQMDTLGGAFSNLGDTFDNLLLQMGESGLAGAVQGSIKDLTATLSDPATIKAATALTTALVDGLTFAYKSAISFGLALTDMGNALGAYAAAAAAAFSLDFDGAKAILKARDEQLVATNAAIDKIWEEKKATEELNKTKGAPVVAATAPVVATVQSVPPAGLSDEEKKALQTRLDRLQEHYATEQELALMAYTEKATAIQELEDAKIGTDAEREELRLQVAQEYADRMTEIETTAREKRISEEQNYWDRLFNMQAGSQQAGIDFAKNIRDNDLKSALGNGAAMLANAAKNNKAMFKVQKAFALANAAVALPDAILQSFRNGGGYPWGLIPAGLMAAAGMQQINAIRSSSFGGGGGAASVGGGGGGTSPSAPVVSGLPPGSTALPNSGEQPVQTRELRVVVEGDGPHSQGMRKLLIDLAATAEDMGGINKLVIA